MITPATRNGYVSWPWLVRTPPIATHFMLLRTLFTVAKSQIFTKYVFIDTLYHRLIQKRGINENQYIIYFIPFRPFLSFVNTLCTISTVMEFGKCTVVLGGLIIQGFLTQFTFYSEWDINSFAYGLFQNYLIL